MTLLAIITQKIGEEGDFVLLQKIIPFERVRRLPGGDEKIRAVKRAFLRNESPETLTTSEEVMLLEALKERQDSMRTVFFGSLWPISVNPVEVITRVQEEQHTYSKRWQTIQNYLQKLQSDVHSDTEYDNDSAREQYLDWIVDMLSHPDIRIEHCHNLNELEQSMINQTLEMRDLDSTESALTNRQARK